MIKTGRQEINFTGWLDKENITNPAEIERSISRFLMRNEKELNINTMDVNSDGSFSLLLDKSVSGKYMPPSYEDDGYNDDDSMTDFEIDCLISKVDQMLNRKCHVSISECEKSSTVRWEEF